MNGQSCETWRLLCDPPMAGARNMAVDEALLRTIGAGEAPPTLRLYDWQPPTLSLGFGQPLHDVDETRLEEHGWGLVRRLTGGRAILHTDELTYSITLPIGHRLAQGSVIESYRRISAALAAAAQNLGATTQAERAAERGAASAVCFETPSHYELTVGGRKLAGSAQARRHDGLLQHGALPISGDLGRIVDALAFEDDAARERARARVEARTITLSRAAGRLITWDEVADALTHAVETEFSVCLERGELSTAEATQAVRLESETYGAREWTARR
ncbi:MAG: octanoyltransferase [Anaerolineae bacterium]